mmetsp:Transcript_71256/g.154855  ORF Transcript_71256/g.154855 Transcript_71256/m.154855 type:complete len:151 (+) Transcript_71256:105-557(+)
MAAETFDDSTPPPTRGQGVAGEAELAEVQRQDLRFAAFVDEFQTRLACLQKQMPAVSSKAPLTQARLWRHTCKEEFFWLNSKGRLDDQIQSLEEWACSLKAKVVETAPQRPPTAVIGDWEGAGQGGFPCHGSGPAPGHNPSKRFRRRRRG